MRREVGPSRVAPGAGLSAVPPARSAVYLRSHGGLLRGERAIAAQQWCIDAGEAPRAVLPLSLDEHADVAVAYGVAALFTVVDIDPRGRVGAVSAGVAGGAAVAS